MKSFTKSLTTIQVVLLLPDLLNPDSHCHTHKACKFCLVSFTLSPSIYFDGFPLITSAMKPRRNLYALAAVIMLAGASSQQSSAQTETTGAFEGKVVDGVTGKPIERVAVRIIYQFPGYQDRTVLTDNGGRFREGLLAPGEYKIQFSASGYESLELQERLFATRVNVVIPSPVALEPRTRIDVPVARGNLA